MRAPETAGRKVCAKVFNWLAPAPSATARAESLFLRAERGAGRAGRADCRLNHLKMLSGRRGAGLATARAGGRVGTLFRLGRAGRSAGLWGGRRPAAGAFVRNNNERSARPKTILARCACVLCGFQPPLALTGPLKFAEGARPHSRPTDRALNRKSCQVNLANETLAPGRQPNMIIAR